MSQVKKYMYVTVLICNRSISYIFCVNFLRVHFEYYKYRLV